MNIGGINMRKETVQEILKGHFPKCIKELKECLSENEILKNQRNFIDKMQVKLYVEEAATTLKPKASREETFIIGNDSFGVDLEEVKNHEINREGKRFFADLIQNKEVMYNCIDIIKPSSYQTSWIILLDSDLAGEIEKLLIKVIIDLYSVKLF